MRLRYTNRAHRALLLAQQEALNLSHPRIDTEHLLLGLLAQGEGIAYNVLKEIGLDYQAVLTEVQKMSEAYPQAATMQVTPHPRLTKITQELAPKEAAAMGYNYIGTEHLLLALAGETEGLASRILEKSGADYNKIKELVAQALGQPQTPNEAGSPKRAARGASSTPNLNTFGRDLTELARNGKLDPVIGRNKEIERVIQILARRTKNNPVLIGDPGVGKTAIAEGLAQRIVEGKVPEVLLNKRVVTLDLAGLVAGTKYRGEFEERLKKIVDEIRSAENIVLFIDEMHTLVGAGAAEGAIDASNILKPALARGELQCIGATTIDEYRKYVEKDAALERRFQPIKVEEPTVEETIAILKGLKEKYESHHKVEITEEAMVAAARLSDRYVTDRYLPDKAIDLIDEAASKVRMGSLLAPPNLKDLEDRISEVRKEKTAAVNAQEYEKAARLRDEERRLQEELDSQRREWENQRMKSKCAVTEEDIAQVVSAWTGIPVSKLAMEETQRLLNMEKELHKRVIGQDEAVTAISRAIRRARAGLKDPKRPIGSFIFLGPTGVGKTELARALAEVLFGDEDAMVQIDMSEYMERHTVSRLVGAPPGYVGYEEGGQLTEAVRRRPYSVVLLDEIEKAHPEVFNVLLQVLEDGRLTEAKGRTVDFRNTVIIMTSNVGANLIRREATMGFRTDEDDKQRSYEVMRERILEEVKKTFRPEFLNRIDELIVFHSLTEEHLSEIVDLMLARVNKRLSEMGLTVEVDNEAKRLLIKDGYDPLFGARPLRRTIQRMIEDPLSEEVLEGKFTAGDTVLVGVDESGKITFKKSARDTNMKEEGH